MRRMSTLWRRLSMLGGAALMSAATAQDAAQPIPLKEVFLFTSGIGYFQRSAEITGNRSFELSFRTEQVNDVLKSLVVLDPSGSIKPVTYTANEPVSRRIRSSGIALNQNSSLGTVLRQFQGAEVEIAAGDQTATGRILSVSMRSLPASGPGGGIVQVEVLNILGEQGLRAFPVDSLSHVSLKDSRLNRELGESLKLLAEGLDDQRRTVKLEFNGNGARTVSAGYLQETPVWKTSYRMVLDKNQKPYLQGWALVENTTDEDWAGVKLTLVSGRPVSFIQNLYQPLYVPRPVVQPQVSGSPTPQLFGEAVDKLEREAQQVVQNRSMFRAAPAPAAPAAGRGAPAGPGGPFGGGLGGVGMAGKALADSASLGIALRNSVTTAVGAERGDLFEYRIAEAVKLGKGQAAMVPIVGAAVDGEKISIFDRNTDEKFAMHGFRLTNNTGLHLSGGPVTVLQDGGYAGDAQIGHIQPNDSRLLTYAVDLDLTPDVKEPRFQQQTVSYVAKSGLLILTRKLRQEFEYSFRNKSAQAKDILVQHAGDEGFKLVEPAKAEERTADSYRFRVTCKPNETTTLKVVFERPVEERVALIDLDLNALSQYALNGQVSEKLRAALKQLVVLRRQLVDIQGRQNAFNMEIQAITQEQTRIRGNMTQLDRNSALYMQYVRKLTDQETRIEKIREEQTKLKDAERAVMEELRKFVDTLTAD